MQKPELTLAIKKTRLAFVIRYKNWTIKNLKRVIWIDKTSIVLGQKRGNHQLWKASLKGKKLVVFTIWERYYKNIEFMF